MNKRLFLHIGFGKTGTTAIQSFFAANSDYLAQHDFFYPKAGRQGDAHHQLAPLGTASISGELAAEYAKLNNELRSRSETNAIISTEYLTFVHPQLVHQIRCTLSDYDIIVIFYVREQVELIESVFLQWQKVGDNYLGEIKAFFEANKDGFDLERRIAPWAEHFGRDAIHCRIYDKRVIGDDVCADICRVIGIQSEDPVPGSQENISLRPELSSLLRLVDDAGIDDSHRTAIVDELLKVSLLLRGIKPHSLITAELRDRIVSFFAASNAAFAATYLDEVQAGYLCEQATSS